MRLQLPRLAPARCPGHASWRAPEQSWLGLTAGGALRRIGSGHRIVGRDRLIDSEQSAIPGWQGVGGYSGSAGPFVAIAPDVVLAYFIDGCVEEARIRR